MSAASCRFCPRSWDCRAASESTNGEWMRCTAERSFAAVSVSQRAYQGATVLDAATTMKAFGEAEASIPVYEDVRGVYEKYLDPDDARFGGLYNNMALALADCGRYGEAEDAYEKALVVMSSKKNGALESAITLINMAELYERALGDSEGAVGRCMDQAYECLKTPGIDHDGYYAFVCRKCAPSFGHFGYFAAQRELDAEADEIYAGN